MNFENIKNLYCSGKVVTIDGVTKEIITELKDASTIQFLNGRTFIIEEPSMKKVSLSKYQYIIDEYREAIDNESVVEEVVENTIQKSVSMRQVRLWLYRNDRLDLVEDYVKTSKEAEIEWNYSTSVERISPIVLSIGEYLGMSEQELDTIFIEASTL